MADIYSTCRQGKAEGRLGAGQVELYCELFKTHKIISVQGGGGVEVIKTTLPEATVVRRGDN